MYIASASTKQPLAGGFDGPPAQNAPSPDPFGIRASIQTRFMTVIHKVLSLIKNDHESLRQAAITVELARYRGSDLRRLQLDASKVFSRHSAFSVEFFLPYTIMALVFVIHPPLVAPPPELFQKVAYRLFWAAGFAINFWVIYRSKGWLLYHLYFPHGIASFVLGAIALFSVSSFGTIVLLDMLYLKLEGGTAAPRLSYLKLLLLMLAVVSAIVLLSTAYRVIYGYPFFGRVSGEGLFLSLLPVNNRGALISISADDHYVEVVTDRGTSHIRLNFCNAMKLLSEVRGIQVHRSHWVSLNAIRDIRMEPSGKATLRLSNDTELPVARSRVKSLKARLQEATVTGDT